MFYLFWSVNGVRPAVLCTMKTFLLEVAVMLCLVCVSSVHSRGESESEFQDYVSEFGKVYQTVEEHNIRYDIWISNKAEIDRHNAEAARGLHSYTMGINQFTDMTREEFRRTMLTRFEPRTPHHDGFSPDTLQDPLPDSVDWKAKGYTTEVGNQGACGSCWAFTATGALEGQHKKATGTLIDLSEQNLMDCSAKQGNNGCEGGYMDWSFKYVKENGGIDTEQSYPYNVTNPATNKCRYTVANRGATCTGYVDLPKDNETALQQAVAMIGPIAVAVDATHAGFEMYKSGVYDDPNCSTRYIGHSLVITGYGVEDGKEFWECKNSWGTSWGNKGYIRMSRNKNSQCGIASMASYPTV